MKQIITDHISFLPVQIQWVMYHLSTSRQKHYQFVRHAHYIFVGAT